MFKRSGFFFDQVHHNPVLGSLHIDCRIGTLGFKLLAAQPISCGLRRQSTWRKEIGDEKAYDVIAVGTHDQNFGCASVRLGAGRLCKSAGIRSCGVFLCDGTYTTEGRIA